MYVSRIGGFHQVQHGSRRYGSRFGGISGFMIYIFLNEFHVKTMQLCNPPRWGNRQHPREDVISLERNP
jgi:hypothetical protein